MHKRETKIRLVRSIHGRCIPSVMKSPCSLERWRWIIWGLQEWRMCSRECSGSLLSHFCWGFPAKKPVTHNTQMVWNLNYTFLSAVCAGWDNYTLKNESHFTESAKLSVQWRCSKVWMDVRESQYALAQGIPWSQWLIQKVLRICLCQVPALWENSYRILLKWAIVQLSPFEWASGLHTTWFSLAPGHLCGFMWQKVSCRLSCGAGAIGKGAGAVWGQTAPGCGCWQVWCCILHLYCFKCGWECHQRVQPASVQ